MLIVVYNSNQASSVFMFQSVAAGHHRSPAHTPDGLLVDPRPYTQSIGEEGKHRRS